MTKVKTERNLKVYGYESKWHDFPAEIRLKGKWLKEFGFNCGDRIKIKCYKNRLVVSREEWTESKS